MRQSCAGFTAQAVSRLITKLPIALQKAENLDFIPYTVKYGKWVPGPFDGICWWTNGFWPAYMWAGWRLTGDERYKREAERAEACLDEAFSEFDHLHHDVGFMWLISSGASFRMTGSDLSRKRTLAAANLLAGRFNPAGFIRAWNEDRTGWAIIDCMMNLNLLYWASEYTGDPRFRKIAMTHADTAMRHFVREDGSCNHIVVFDPETLKVLDTPAGQGYAPGSAWSRGQAWAVYGFTLSYLHTDNEAYLAVAKKTASYFIDQVKEDLLPKCDFRQPAEDELRDACAGAVAASGLLELARCTGEKEWLDAGVNLLRALDERTADWTDASPAILTQCTGAYHGNDHNIAMIYADFFFAEALLKLNGDSFLFW
ncbi:MAG: glycoside hydrolase family 88 protein [Clostridia bacterium]|nr:glycoside hydrolase family 88 protein [Clostridia bacterium]